MYNYNCIRFDLGYTARKYPVEIEAGNEGTRGDICIQVPSVSNPSPIIPVPRRLSVDAIG